MTKQKTIQIRMDESDIASLRELADENHVGFSEMIRHELEPLLIESKVASIAKDFGYIRSVSLFGSIARMEHDEDSDIDLLIETDDTVYGWFGDDGLAAFIERVEYACDRDVDVVDSDYLTDDLSDSIEKDRRRIYARSA